MEKEISYTEALNQVQQILQKLNQQDFDIDTLANEVQRATELLAVCKGKLVKAEGEVEAILNPQK